MRKILLLLFILITPLGFAEEKFTLTINPPQVAEQYSGLTQQIAAASQNIKDDIIQEIGPYIEKPQLLSAFANSLSFAKPQSSLSAYGNIENFSINLGSQIAMESFSLKIEDLREAFRNFSIEDDSNFGAGAHTLTLQSNIRIKKIPGAFYLGLRGGFFKINIFDFKLFSLNSGIYTNYRFLNNIDWPGPFSWHGILIGSGLDFCYNKIYTSTVITPFSETFTFDPDGDGPLFPQPGQIYLEPEVDAGIKGWVFSIPIELSSSISLLKIFNLGFGCALDLQFGKSALFFNADTPVNLQGSLSSYQEEEGSANFSGEVFDGKADILKFRIFLVPGLLIGPMQIDVPLSYYFKNGITAGLLMGFKF